MFADTALARRIEHGEALNAAGCGEWLAVAGGYAAFSGVGSPLTHAIGLGLDGPFRARISIAWSIFIAPAAR